MPENAEAIAADALKYAKKHRLNQLKRLGRRIPFFVQRIADDSMYPTFEDGDWVIARRRRRVMPGDRIVCRQAGKRTFRRVSGTRGHRAIAIVCDNPYFAGKAVRCKIISRKAVLGVIIWPKDNR